MVAIAVVVGLLVAGALVNSGDRTQQRAEEACHRFVAGRLPVPQTARFSHDRFAIGRAHHYSVRGYVRAQTVDGATTGRSYTCLVSADGDQWHLYRLTLGPA